MEAVHSSRRTQAKNLFAQPILDISLLRGGVFQGNQLCDQGVFGLAPETGDFDFQCVTLFGRKTTDQFSQRRLWQLARPGFPAIRQVNVVCQFVPLDCVCGNRNPRSSVSPRECFRMSRHGDVAATGPRRPVCGPQSRTSFAPTGSGATREPCRRVLVCSSAVVALLDRHALRTISTRSLYQIHFFHHQLAVCD